MAAKIDVWRPCSADFGGDCSGGLLSGGVRRASDIPFNQRMKNNPAHLATQLHMGEIWDPYAGLAPGRAQTASLGGPVTSPPFGMHFGLGQTWKGSKRMLTDPPDAATDPARKASNWIPGSVSVSMECRRGFAAVLERCTIGSNQLFKRFCACDGDGKTKEGKISCAQFELCLRSLGITATKQVLQLMLDTVCEPDGQVDYLKFINDLDVKDATKRPVRTTPASYTPYTRLKTPEAFDAELRGWTTVSESAHTRPSSTGPLCTDPFKHFKDIRLKAELDPCRKLKGHCFFKPRHLVSGFAQSPASTFCLPGGMMRDLSETTNVRHPVERDVQNREMTFHRDSVLAQDIAASRAARRGVSDE